MASKWTISFEGKQYHLQGFISPKRGRSHAKKHFLAENEAWRALCDDGERPNDFKRQLREVGVTSLAHAEIMNRAAARYEEVVAAHGQSHAIDRLAVVWRQPDGSSRFRFKIISLVSKAGYFAAFHQDGVSDLLTAFRPSPRVGRGTRKPRHFLAGARDKFARDVARNELLCGEPKHARDGHKR